MNIRNVFLVLIVVILVTFAVRPSMSQQKPLGIFAGATDVGNPSKSGAVSYNEETQQYAIEGAGTNMWLGRDEFHFAWQRLKGTFILTTRAQFVSKGVEQQRTRDQTFRY